MLSALHAGRFTPPPPKEIFLVLTIQGHSATVSFMSMKNFKDQIWNGTRNFSTEAPLAPYRNTESQVVDGDLLLSFFKYFSMSQTSVFIHLKNSRAQDEGSLSL